MPIRSDTSGTVWPARIAFLGVSSVLSLMNVPAFFAYIPDKLDSVSMPQVYRSDTAGEVAAVVHISSVASKTTLTNYDLPRSRQAKID